MKRVFPLVLCLFMLAGMLPRPAKAFAPVAVLAAPQIVTATGGIAMGLLAGVVGLVGLYLEISDLQGESVRVPLGNNPTNPIPVPVAPASTTPTTTPVLYERCNNVIRENATRCNSGATDVDAANNFCAGGGNGSCVYATNMCTDNNVTCGVSFSTGGEATCPAGYTLVSGNCNLTGAPQVATPDHSYGYNRNGDSFAPISTQDADAVATPMHINNNGIVSVPGRTADGLPTVTHVQPQTGGATQVVQQTQTPAGQIVQYVYNISPTGQITTATTTTATGTLNVDPITGVTTVTAPQGIINPDGSTNTGVQPTTPQQEIKIDTCGLPGKPACAIDDTGFTNKDTFSAPKSSEISTKLDERRTGLDTAKDTLPQIASNWLPSLMPGAALACEPIPVDHNISHGPLAGFSHHTEMNLCPYLDIIRQILGYLLFVMTVFYVWRNFHDANKGQ